MVFAGILGACTNDVVEIAQNDVNSVARPQIDLTLSVPDVESRMTNGAPEGVWGVKEGFSINDILGAVLVDNGYTNNDALPNYWNNVDWTVVGGHVGNNKWVYEGGKFKTAGTTSVGAWLFYTKYNEKMTTTRNGIEFDFPQIQDGAADYEKIMNNNINFYISPVCFIDGYEGDKIEFNIAMASVYSYLRMPFDFSEVGVNKVQKIVVTAKDNLLNPVKFPTKYKIINTAVEKAKLSLKSTLPAIKCENYAPTESYDVNDQIAEMNRAWNAMMYNDYSDATYVWPAVPSFTATTESRDNASDKDFLVVDLDENHSDAVAENGGGMAVEEGKFAAFMLIPAGVYGQLSFDIYTDKGVFTKTIVDRNAYRENIKEGTPAQSGINAIFLRPGKNVVLSDIENKLRTTGNTDKKLSDEEYIKIEEADKIDKGDIITKTVDLVNFINGITKAETHSVNVLSQDQIGNPGEDSADDEAIPAHGAIINQDVITALENKEAELNGDIQLVFDVKMLVKGGTDNNTRMNLHDMTFTNGCDVEGFVKATDDIITPQTMLIKDAANMQLSLNNENIYRIDVNSNAKVTVSKNANISAVSNAGNINFKASLETNYLSNAGTITVAADKVLTVKLSMNNSGTANINGTLDVKEIANEAGANLTNAGVLNVNSLGVNNGVFTNSGAANIYGIFTNNNAMTIAAGSEIIVKSTSNGQLLNSKGATIVNYGDLYTTTSGNNTIDNLGQIDVMSGSTTYITTNSKEDEKYSYSTNDANQIMGVLNFVERNPNMTVTKENYQGYKVYNVAETDLTDGVFAAVKNDKFNKIILTKAAELSPEASYVNYIETNSNLTLPLGAKIQELTFTESATLYAEPATKAAEAVIVSQLTINEGKKLTIPTDNELYVYGLQSIKTSKTDAKIKNGGTILLGGLLWTELTKPLPTEGTFASGHGDDTAYRWNTLWGAIVW